MTEHTEITRENSSPPGPNGLPVVGNTLAFAREPFEFVARSTAQFGDLIRLRLLGQGEIYVFAHPEYAEQVLRSNVDAFGKTADFRRAFGDGLVSVEGDRWRAQREVLQPLFGQDRIRTYTDRMNEQIDRRIGRWRDGDVRDIEAEMKNLTLDILFATLFGRELDIDGDHELRTSSHGLNDWFVPTSWVLPEWMPTPSRRRFRRSNARLRREVRRLLDDRDRVDRGDDLLSLLATAQEADDSPLTDAQIEDQLITMVFAGHETTATALTFAWYLLATHPGVRDRFHAELESVLDGEPPSPTTVEKLEYTDRLLTETLRLFPPVHTIPRKTTTDVEVGGYHIPQDRQVFLATFHIHRDGRFYERPEAFHPDRWTRDFEAGLHEFAYFPFGGGHRLCIGRQFALLEAKLVLAMIGQRFELDWSGGEIELDPEITTQPKNEMVMKIAERSSTNGDAK